MPDDTSRNYLAQSSPWLALHDLRQEIQELRAKIEGLSSSRPGTPSSALTGNWDEVMTQLKAIETRVTGLQGWEKLFNVRVTPQTVLLADVRRVERLNEDERIAGFLLAVASLFLGAWLQNLIDSLGAMVISVGAAVCFGGLALFYYRRSHRHWQQLNEEGQFPLWPLQGEATDRPPQV